MKNIIIIFIAFFVYACNSISQPKPNSYLRLEYPNPRYKEVNFIPNLLFDFNETANLNMDSESTFRIVYPYMKATLYLNYNSINENLDSLLNDAYKLPYKHISKAESIPEKLFINEEKKVFGTLFSVVGNAASQYQFFLTDSSNHFLVGSLYFYARPNYDSIFPAVHYLQKDIIRLMESLTWK